MVAMGFLPVDDEEDTFGFEIRVNRVGPGTDADIGTGAGIVSVGKGAVSATSSASGGS